MVAVGIACCACCEAACSRCATRYSIGWNGAYVAAVATIVDVSTKIHFATVITTITIWRITQPHRAFSRHAIRHAVRRHGARKSALAAVVYFTVNVYFAAIDWVAIAIRKSGVARLDRAFFVVAVPDGPEIMFWLVCTANSDKQY